MTRDTEDVVARKLAMFMFDTWGDAEGVVWAGLDNEQRENARKAARAAIKASGLEDENARFAEALQQIRALNGQNYDSDRAWALAMQLRAVVSLKGWLGDARAALHQEGIAP